MLAGWGGPNNHASSSPGGLGGGRRLGALAPAPRARVAAVAVGLAASAQPSSAGGGGGWQPPQQLMAASPEILGRLPRVIETDEDLAADVAAEEAAGGGLGFGLSGGMGGGGTATRPLTERNSGLGNSGLSYGGTSQSIK